MAVTSEHELSFVQGAWHLREKKRLDAAITQGDQTLGRLKGSSEYQIYAMRKNKFVY